MYEPTFPQASYLIWKNLWGEPTPMRRYAVLFEGITHSRIIHQLTTNSHQKSWRAEQIRSHAQRSVAVVQETIVVLD